MALPGETMGPSVVEIVCDDCGVKVPRKVLQSGGGWYIGFFCPNCGPWSRESGYYPTEEAAKAALASEQVSWR